MKTEELREQVRKNIVIAAMRSIYGDDLMHAVEIFVKHGIRMIEVTFDQADPDALRKTSKCIAALKEKFGSSILVGAGTVMEDEQVIAAREAGAEYILSPDTNTEIIRKAAELGLPSIPGAMTPSEVATAWHNGAAVVKLFPAGNLGVGYCKSICAPLDNVLLLPMGGVNKDNAKEFMAIDNVIGLGMANALVDKKLIAAHDWAGLEAKTKDFMETLKG